MLAAPYKTIGFLEYTVMSGAEYWALLGRLGAWSGDDRVGVVALRPDYVQATGGQEGAFEIRLSSSADQYHSDVRRGINPGYADCLYIAEAVTWVPPSGAWVAYGERDVTTIVVGARQGSRPEFGEMARGCRLRPLALEEILDIAKLDFGLYDRAPESSRPGSRERWEAYAAEFRRNYDLGCRVAPER